MGNGDCIHFLQWSLPRLRMRWQGFRKVRGRICKRVRARAQKLGLRDMSAYRSYLELHLEEFAVFDSYCRISISRFFRDRGMFEFLEREVLPGQILMLSERKKPGFRCWSVGCASGEEPYSLALLWNIRFKPLHPDRGFSIIATDVDEALLHRARAGCYDVSSLRELPVEWRDQVFTKQGPKYCIGPAEREQVAFLRQDIRIEAPETRFHLVLCRNLAFTYFEESLQQEVLHRIGGRMTTQGILVIGVHEHLPPDNAGFEEVSRRYGIYRKR